MPAGRLVAVDVDSIHLPHILTIIHKGTCAIAHDAAGRVVAHKHGAGIVAIAHCGALVEHTRDAAAAGKVDHNRGIVGTAVDQAVALTGDSTAIGENLELGILANHYVAHNAVGSHVAKETAIVGAVGIAGVHLARSLAGSVALGIEAHLVDHKVVDSVPLAVEVALETQLAIVGIVDGIDGVALAIDVGHHLDVLALEGERSIVADGAELLKLFAGANFPRSCSAAVALEGHGRNVDKEQLGCLVAAYFESIGILVVVELGRTVVEDKGIAARGAVMAIDHCTPHEIARHRIGEIVAHQVYIVARGEDDGSRGYHGNVGGVGLLDARIHALCEGPHAAVEAWQAGSAGHLGRVLAIGGIGHVGHLLVEVAVVERHVVVLVAHEGCNRVGRSRAHNHARVAIVERRGEIGARGLACDFGRLSHQAAHIGAIAVHHLARGVAVAGCDVVDSADETAQIHLVGAGSQQACCRVAAVDHNVAGLAGDTAQQHLLALVGINRAAKRAVARLDKRRGRERACDEASYTAGKLLGGEQQYSAARDAHVAQVVVGKSHCASHIAVGLHAGTLNLDITHWAHAAASHGAHVEARRRKSDVGHLNVVDRAPVATHKHAGIVARRGDAGMVKFYVLEHCIGASDAEEAHIVVGIVLELEMLDGVPLAVEGAVEAIVAGAYGHIGRRPPGEVDVGSQCKMHVLVDGIVAVVLQVGGLGAAL